MPPRGRRLGLVVANPVAPRTDAALETASVWPLRT
jgi:hypothetical protein